jgi:hypothetical protein
MEKIAIDIVLLPSREMTEKAIAISDKLADTSGKSTIILNEQDCLPHISLCMGAIRSEDLPAISDILGDITSQRAALQLTVQGIKAHDIPTGEKLAVLEVVNREPLQELQKTLMQRLQKYLSYDVDTSMFFGSPQAEPVSVKWVKDFDRSQPSPMPYYPHITSGFGEYSNFEFPIDFTASTLAICHLGNYCTCRKVLGSFDLQQ